MKYDFITIGGLTRDISFFTDQGIFIKNPQDILRQELLAFEYGDKIKVDQFHYSYGGGAANSAVCLANFSLKVACLGVVGDDDNSKYIIKNLLSRKVDISLIKKSPGEESGTSFILVDPSGERIIFSQRGANRKLNLESSDVSKLKSADNIYIASLAGNWKKDLNKIFSSLNLERQQVFWNPGMTQLLNGVIPIKSFIKKTTVLAMNKDEALQLIYSSNLADSYPEKYLNKAENLAKLVYAFGPKVVVITLGKEGVVAYDGQQMYRRDILKRKKVVDTTGIGDVFNSSFAAGYVLYKSDINKSLSLALRNAAAKVSNLGAQSGLITIKDIKK